MSLAMTPENATPAHWALGRLSWDAVPMAHEPIVLWTFIAVVLGGVAADQSLAADVQWLLLEPFPKQDLIGLVAHGQFGIDTGMDKDVGVRFVIAHSFLGQKVPVLRRHVGDLAR